MCYQNYVSCRHSLLQYAHRQRGSPTPLLCLWCRAAPLLPLNGQCIDCRLMLHKIHKQMSK